ncbi:mitochondrial ribosomal small subunit component [Nowakowskiella sp. JEL0407]|nr:mitochondrial ribosomal small subunit component [Nowakowskiella sp. JEL0407]
MRLSHNPFTILENFDRAAPPTKNPAVKPAWYAAVQLHQPAAVSLRTVDPLETGQFIPTGYVANMARERLLEATSPKRRQKSHHLKYKIQHFSKPLEIRFPEDDLRDRFYKQHPWELHRPVVILETDETLNACTARDWSTIYGGNYSTHGVTGENVVQHTLYLQNVPKLKDEILSQKNVNEERKKDAVENWLRVREEVYETVGILGKVKELESDISALPVDSEDRISLQKELDAIDAGYPEYAYKTALNRFYMFRAKKELAVVQKLNEEMKIKVEPFTNPNFKMPKEKDPFSGDTMVLRHKGHQVTKPYTYKTQLREEEFVRKSHKIVEEALSK